MGVTEPGACLNCGAELTGPYCASCGQKTPHVDVDLREFLQEATHELTNWEGKVPHTLKALFLQPGLLTLDFLAGRRARWLSPLRLYLICSLAYFVSDPLVESITHRSARELAKITVTSPDGRLTLSPEGREQIEGSQIGRIFGRERLERAIANYGEFDHALDTAYPKAMFLLLPLFALLTNVAWRDKMPRYPAHLYLALHLHAAWFGALAISTVVTVFASTTWLIMFGFVALAYSVGYGLFALRRVFDESWGRTIAKAAAIGAVYSAFLYAVSLGMLGYAIAMM
jgi:hypothetical protein